MRHTTAARGHQCGQGMTEYIIIVALIAIAAIAVYQLFGRTVRSQTAAIAQELAGEDGSPARTNAATAAGAAVRQGNRTRGLNEFTNNINAND